MVKNITVVEKILSANDRIAAENRSIFDVAGVKAFNLMASPGAGKTSLIDQTLKHLSPVMKLAVIDGDIATNIDAERAKAAGAIAIQINTGGECHLDALVINKIDLLPYVPFNMPYFRKGVEILNPGLVTFPLSCKTGEGVDMWI